VVNAVEENTDTIMDLNEEYQETMEEVADDCTESYTEIENAAGSLTDEIKDLNADSA